VVGPDPLPLPPAGDALLAGAARQQLDLVAGHEDAAAEGELGRDPPSAVDAVGLEVDLADQLGQHRVSD